MQWAWDSCVIRNSLVEGPLPENRFAVVRASMDFQKGGVRLAIDCELAGGFGERSPNEKSFSRQYGISPKVRHRHTRGFNRSGSGRSSSSDLSLPHAGT